MDNQMTTQIVGYQSWKQLLFLHWRVTADMLQKCLPDGLTVEQFDGSAWLAVVPFSMERVRPWWSPPVPGISWFLETNLRTYVRHKNGDSGVWFFSLDANHRLAVAVARRFWHLNYRYAKLSLTAKECDRTYTGHLTTAGYSMKASLPESPRYRTADPGSLEHFLLERYRLFAQSPSGNFYSGMVHHKPYAFTDATVVNLKQTLTDTIECRLRDAGVPDHVAYSQGVDVSVSPLMKIH
jgi:uncharacterized protein YqjF (DUF2071 family)